MSGKSEKARGLRREAELVKAFGWVPSSTKDNVTKDIDAWTIKGTPISIKSINAKTFRTGNLAFELEVCDEKRGWEPAWYQFGQARKYVFDIEGRGVYVLDKEELNKYVELYGWDKVVQLSAKTRRSQAAMGHRHTNAKIGLLKLSSLTRVGVAKRLIVPAAPTVRPSEAA